MLILLLCFYMLVAHWLACVWYSIGRSDAENGVSKIDYVFVLYIGNLRNATPRGNLDLRHLENVHCSSYVQLIARIHSTNIQCCTWNVFLIRMLYAVVSHQFIFRIVRLEQWNHSKMLNNMFHFFVTFNIGLFWIFVLPFRLQVQYSWLWKLANVYVFFRLRVLVGYCFFFHSRKEIYFLFSNTRIY